uniref:Putative secreted protein n=1 Tax=Ixodes ricinus TaxID=34613 RepID=A0A6B0U922_IXORI
MFAPPSAIAVVASSLTAGLPGCMFPPPSAIAEVDSSLTTGLQGCMFAPPSAIAMTASSLTAELPGYIFASHHTDLCRGVYLAFVRGFKCAKTEGTAFVFS